MSKLEDLFLELPKGAQVSVIGRGGGAHRKYEAKLDRYAQTPYVFTGWTPQEAVEKLLHKLEFPDHCMHCHCCCNCKDKAKS